MNRRLLLTLAIALLALGCNKAAETPTTPTVTSPVTTTFTSRLPRGGSVSRSFTTSTSGQISVTLKGINSPTKIGVGLGAPLGAITTTIANCTLTTSVETTGGTNPQISALAPAGTYCVALYDLGTLTTAIDFDLSITYP